MKVKDIMTTQVATLKSEDTVEAAANLMKQYDVGSIPVCDNQNIVGIVTDRDITLRTVAEGQNSKQQRVSSIMSSNISIGTPDMDVNDAARIMSEKQIRRLPIVSNNQLVGVVALGDISLEPTLRDNAEDALTSISQPKTF